MFIYNKDTIDFDNNGIGYLKDVISASVIDVLNGDYSLTFEYPTNSKLSEYIIEDNIVKCVVANGSKQLFMITNVVKNFDTLKVQAKHIFYKLLYNILEDVYPQNLNANDFLNWILNHTQYENNFNGYSNISSTFKSARYIRKNPVEAILGSDDNTMVNLYGGELERDNFDIHFNSRIGNDEKVKLIFGKNITGININIDNTDCYTRIMPIGYDELMLPEKYVDSELINTYPFPRIAIYKFEDIKYNPDDEEAYHNLNDAYDALRNKVQELFNNGIDKPSVNMTIDWVELSKTEEYKHYASLERVHLGDTIYANILGVEFETRVIKTTYNPLSNIIEKFEIGTIKPSIATSMNNIVKTVANISPDSILTQAQQNATSLITQAMGGYVYKTQSELYIMDTNNPQTAEKVWRWNINGLGYSSTGINGPYGIAMTMDGSIVADYITTGSLNTNVIEGYDSLVIDVRDATQQVAALSLTVAELNSKIKDVLDITTSAESNNGVVNLYNVNASEPIAVQINANIRDIKKLYPSDLGLFPSENLYPKSGAILTFKNVDTSDIYEYELPGDLLYLNNEVYDTFNLSYDESICQIIKRVGINNQGQKYELPVPVIESYTYPHIMLPTANEYEVKLVGVSEVYLFVRLMSSNIYTTQFATKVEMNSTINQTAQSITLDVDRKIDLVDEDIDTINGKLELKIDKDDDGQIVSMLNASADRVYLNSNRLVVNSSQFQLDANGNATFGGNLNAASGSFSGTLNASNGQIGRYQITSTYLQTGSGSSQTGIGGARAFWAGAESSASAPFNVSYEGALTATNANITGTIHSNSGSIGGLNISSGGLSNARASISNSGTISCFNSSGGSMILSNAARLSATAGVGISSNSTGNVSAPSKNIDIKACSLASVYLGCMSDSGGSSERNGITIYSGGIAMSRQPSYGSDKRLKTKINEIEDVSWIDELKVKEYEYKVSPGEKNIGLIAQDYEDKEYAKYFLNKDLNGMYCISYTDISNALILYCQQLKKQINNQQQQIDYLQKQINELKGIDEEWHM